MAISATDLDWIRQWVGGQPDDATLDARLALSGSRSRAALYVLRQRRANFVRKPATLSAEDVSQGTAANIAALEKDIARLEAIVAAEDPTEDGGSATGYSTFLTRPDRTTRMLRRGESETYIAAGMVP